MKAPIFGLRIHRERREIATKRVIGKKNRLINLPDARARWMSITSRE
jgi:hypothetical protein